MKKKHTPIRYAIITSVVYRNTTARILRDFGSFAMLDVPGAYISLSEHCFRRINP